MKRLLYVVLDDMIPLTSNSFIIVNSVTKDLNDNISTFRCAALRCLSRLMTPQIAPSVERFFKQTLVDSNTAVQIASLICCLRLPADIVQKYLTETGSCVDSPNALVQYHAVRLFLFIKQKDEHSLLRFITTKAPSITSSLAQTELIRAAQRLYQRNPEKNESMINYIVNITSGSPAVVVVESLRALLKVGHLKGLTKLVPKLQSLLSSGNIATRFAAARIASELAVKAPEILAQIRSDVEALLKDSNRAVVILATSAALRVATEQNIEKLLKKIGKFIQNLPDTFRIQVLETIEQTAEKYPSKHAFLLNFLGGLLGVKGEKFCDAVVTTMLGVTGDSQDNREQMLNILGEYIEDCQYESVVRRVIDVIGEFGPSCTSRVKYMRTIYNRIILEGPCVRAAGVSALYRFAQNKEDIENVKTLMKKCTYDENEEVRSRAQFYENVLEEEAQKAVGECAIDEYPLDNLEKALAEYVASGDFSKEFSLETVSKVTEEEAKQKEEEERVQEEESESAKKMHEIFGKLGEPEKTCPSVLVSGIDTEYRVTVTKVVYKKHIALKCMVQNTLSDYQLEGVTISVPNEPEGYRVVRHVDIDVLPPQCEDMAVIILEKSGNNEANIPLQLNVSLREVNSITGEKAEDTTSDEYPLDAVKIRVSDFIGEHKVEDWNSEWSAIPAQNETKVVVKFPGVTSIQEAVDRVKAHFELGVVCDSGVVAEGARKHILYLAGVMNGSVVLIRVRLMVDKAGQVPIEICVRSPSLELSQTLGTSL